MASGQSSLLDDAFRSAKDDFKRSLKNPALFDFSKINSVDDVLEEARKIQRQQAKTKTLRGLKRIEPFINGLKEYASVIEGPLKFILQASSSVILAFEKVVKVLADLGMTLPSFKVYAQLFQSNHDICRALCLFYADILDFYAVLLNFLTNPRLNMFLESLWPKIRSSITKIQDNIEHHKTMMMVNVTLEDILRADEARKRALKEYEDAEAFRDSQTFSAISNEINPEDYDAILTNILRRSSVNSGEWLKNEPDFMGWLDTTDRTKRCIWLHGIPGSGKTFLVGNLVRRMQDSGQRVLFAFLSHDNQNAGDTVNVLHSFVFQLLEGDSSSRSILYEASQSNSRRLRNDSNFIMDLLCKMINDTGPAFIVLDGLDELNDISWKHLLSVVLGFKNKCPETKLLISSREEREISLRLAGKTIPFRVDYNNSVDIDSFVQLECENLLLDIRGSGAGEQTCLKVKEALNTIAEKAEGMFIYARLALFMVKDQGTPQDIEAQIEDLPDGLDEAYGRLLTRIQKTLSQALRTVVRTILQWVACAQRPLREEEMLQILVIRPGQLDFTKGHRAFYDIFKACGPIIEVNDGAIRFVHFSAKEYLLHEQSSNFLNLSEAHLDAALVCATYLSFSSLNPLFSSPSAGAFEIQEQVKSGAYVMFEYASMAFLDHLKSTLVGQDANRNVCLLATLNRFREARTGRSLGILHVPDRFSRMFEVFVNKPDIQAFLSSIAYSQAKAYLGLTDYDEGLDPSIYDPLKILLARRVFRQTLENARCQTSVHEPNCYCEELQRLYGRKIYHCDQFFCHAYRNGFESESARNQHLQIHQRPCKCPVQDCLFAEIGFRSISELQSHNISAHSSQISNEDEPKLDVTLIQSPEDKFDILYDAIMFGQIEDIKGLVRDCARFTDRRHLWRDFICFAAQKTSPDIFSWLLDEDNRAGAPLVPLDMSLAGALEAENLPNIKLLLSRGADMFKSNYLHNNKHLPRTRTEEGYKYDTYTGYTRALSRWSPDLMAYLVGECNIDIPAHIENASEIFYAPAILTATPDEARNRFRGIKQYIIWPEAYAKGVAAAIESECTLSARICLENGGDPNAFIGKPKLLFYCLKSDNFTSKTKSTVWAEMINKLIKHGADTESKDYRGKTIKGSAGVRKIERHFGLKWEEIVHRSQAGEDLVIIS